MRTSVVASLAVAILLTSGGARSQEGSAREAEALPGRQIGLREALAIAVRQNPTLAASAVDVAIAEAQILGARGIEDPTLDANLNLYSNRKDAVEGEPFQQLALDRLALSTGLGKVLDYGGRVGVRLEADYTRTETRLAIMGTASEFDTEVYSPALTMTYAQPFLRGFGREVFLAQGRRARASRDVAALARENATASTVRDVIHAYWELSYSVEDLEIRRSSLTLAEEQLRIVKASIEAGRLAANASAEVEAGIALRGEEVFVAEQVVSERALELRRLAGMEIGPGEIALVATDPPEPALGEPDLDRALANAMERNPQLATVRAQGKAATIEVEVAENGMLPQLDFSGSAGPSANANTPGDAVTRLVELESFTVQAGLVFSAPLGRRGARGALDAARGALRKARLTESEISAQVAVAVVRAVNAVISAKKRIEVLAKSTELAHVNLDTERARFDVGRATNFDVLKRQEELAQARVRQARAKTDFLKAVAVLEALTGDILPRYGIELAK